MSRNVKTKAAGYPRMLAAPFEMKHLDEAARVREVALRLSDWFFKPDATAQASHMWFGARSETPKCDLGRLLGTMVLS